MFSNLGEKKKKHLQTDLTKNMIVVNPKKEEKNIDVMQVEL